MILIPLLYLSLFDQKKVYATLTWY